MKTASSSQDIQGSPSLALSDNGIDLFLAFYFQSAEGLLLANPVPIAKPPPGTETLLLRATINASSLVRDEPSINRHGDIAVLQNNGSTRTIGRYTAANNFVFEPLLPNLTTTAAHVSINDKGQIAFFAFSPDFLPGVYVIEDPSAAPKKIADDSGELKSFFTTSINNAGQVCFTAFRDNNSAAIFRYSGGVSVAVADTAGGFFFAFGAETMNEPGELAFRALAGGFGNEIVYRTNGNDLTPVADTFGPFQSFGDPSLNNLNQLAFTARMDDGWTGVFVGNDPVNDLIIRTGDPLGGSTVSDLFVGQHALSDNGDILFRANLANGNKVLALAQPKKTIQSITLLANGAPQIEGLGIPGREFQLQATTDLAIPFQTVAHGTASLAGKFKISDDRAPLPADRLIYRYSYFNTLPPPPAPQ